MRTILRGYNRRACTVYGLRLDGQIHYEPYEKQSVKANETHAMTPRNGTDKWTDGNVCLTLS